MFKQNIDVLRNIMEEQARPPPSFTPLHSPPVLQPRLHPAVRNVHLRWLPDQINWKITRLPV